MSVINDAQINCVCALSIILTSYFCLNTAQYIHIDEYSECFITDARVCWRSLWGSVVFMIRDKWNLICDVEVCAGLFEVLFCTHPLPRYIHGLFTFLLKDRLTNKSLVYTKLYLFYLSCQESWIYWQKNVNIILLSTRNKVSQREKKSYIKIVILFLFVLSGYNSFRLTFSLQHNRKKM